MTDENMRQAHIGENLRRLRKLRSLRQKDVADAIGLSVSQYTRIELGQKRLYVDTLLAIAEFLSADPGEILGDTPSDRERRAVDAVRHGGVQGGIALLDVAREMLADA